MYLKPVNLSIVLLLVSSCLYSQNSITGRVVDAETGEALPYSSIFFAGTSIGTTTNSEGAFTLSGFSSGKYDFTVTFVGYAVFQQSILFSGETKFKYLIKLTQQSQMLQAVTIRPNDRERKVDIKVFQELLLGKTPQAKRCKIINLDDIHLYRDIEERKLIASSTKPIQIENRALGYRITYHLVLFDYQYGNGKLDVYGIPLFEELLPENEQQKVKWDNERKEAYKGSISHFLLSVVSDSLIEKNYETARILQRPNSMRPPQQLINEKLEYFKKGVESSDGSQNIASLRDSLWHYEHLNNMSVTIDSLVKEVLHGHELLDQDSLNRFTFTNSLVIRYKERENKHYREAVGKYAIGENQSSIMHILSEFKVYENGYYDNTGNLLVEGYWAWSQKVSTMLPVDFSVKEGSLLKEDKKK